MGVYQLKLRDLNSLKVKYRGRDVMNNRINNRMMVKRDRRSRSRSREG